MLAVILKAAICVAFFVAALATFDLRRGRDWFGLCVIGTVIFLIFTVFDIYMLGLGKPTFADKLSPTSTYEVLWVDGIHATLQESNQKPVYVQVVSHSFVAGQTVTPCNDGRLCVVSD